MPTYQAQCDTCNARFEGTVFEIESKVNLCVYCCNDICPDCAGTDWHEDCKPQPPDAKDEA